MNLAGLDHHHGTPKFEKPSDDEPNSYREKIANFLSGWNEKNDSGASKDDLAATELIVKSIDVMQGAIARLKLAAYAPDKTIEIPRDACNFSEFHRAEEMAEIGYKTARKALAQLGS